MAESFDKKISSIKKKISNALKSAMKSGKVKNIATDGFKKAGSDFSDADKKKLKKFISFLIDNLVNVRTKVLELQGEIKHIESTILKQKQKGGGTEQQEGKKYEIEQNQKKFQELEKDILKLMQSSSVALDSKNGECFKKEVLNNSNLHRLTVLTKCLSDIEGIQNAHRFCIKASPIIILDCIEVSRSSDCQLDKESHDNFVKSVGNFIKRKSKSTIDVELDVVKVVVDYDNHQIPIFKKLIDFIGLAFRHNAYESQNEGFTIEGKVSQLIEYFVDYSDYNVNKKFKFDELSSTVFPKNDYKGKGVNVKKNRFSSIENKISSFEVMQSKFLRYYILDLLNFDKMSSSNFDGIINNLDKNSFSGKNRIVNGFIKSLRDGVQAMANEKLKQETGVNIRLLRSKSEVHDVEIERQSAQLQDHEKRITKNSAAIEKLQIEVTRLREGIRGLIKKSIDSGKVVLQIKRSSIKTQEELEKQQNLIKAINEARKKNHAKIKQMKQDMSEHKKNIVILSRGVKDNALKIENNRQNIKQLDSKLNSLEESYEFTYNDIKEIKGDIEESKCKAESLSERFNNLLQDREGLKTKLEEIFEDPMARTLFETLHNVFSFEITCVKNKKIDKKKSVKLLCNALSNVPVMFVGDVLRVVAKAIDVIDNKQSQKAAEQKATFVNSINTMNVTKGNLGKLLDTDYPDINWFPFVMSVLVSKKFLDGKRDISQLKEIEVNSKEVITDEAEKSIIDLAKQEGGNKEGIFDQIKAWNKNRKDKKEQKQKNKPFRKAMKLITGSLLETFREEAVKDNSEFAGTEDFLEKIMQRYNSKASGFGLGIKLDSMLPDQEEQEKEEEVPGTDLQAVLSEKASVAFASASNFIRQSIAVN